MYSKYLPQCKQKVACIPFRILHVLHCFCGRSCDPYPHVGLTFIKRTLCWTTWVNTGPCAGKLRCSSSCHWTVMSIECYRILSIGRLSKRHGHVVSIRKFRAGLRLPMQLAMLHLCLHDSVKVLCLIPAKALSRPGPEIQVFHECHSAPRLYVRSLESWKSGRQRSQVLDSPAYEPSYVHIPATPMQSNRRARKNLVSNSTRCLTIRLVVLNTNTGVSNADGVSRRGTAKYLHVSRISNASVL